MMRKDKVTKEMIVLHILRNPGMTVPEIADSFDMSSNSTYTILWKLAPIRVITMIDAPFVPGTPRRSKIPILTPMVINQLKDYTVPSTDKSDILAVVNLIRKIKGLLPKCVLPGRIKNISNSPDNVDDPIQAQILVKLHGSPQLDFDIKRKLAIDISEFKIAIDTLSILNKIQVIDVPGTSLKVLIPVKSRYIIKDLTDNLKEGK